MSDPYEFNDDGQIIDCQTGEVVADEFAGPREARDLANRAHAAGVERGRKEALAEVDGAAEPWSPEDITAILNLHPEVRWDRWSTPHNGIEGDIGVFGWVDRPDGRADFVLYKFPAGGDAWWSTSSPEFGGAQHDEPCRRVEDAFPEVVNVVRLASDLTAGDKGENDGA